MTSKAFGLAQLGNAYSDGSLSSRNKVINGAMVIDQRNAGAAMTVDNGVKYPVDRFTLTFNTTTGTAQRSTAAPAGFSNSLLTTNGTGASPSSGQYNGLRHEIEGNNIADLNWGTANAQPVTLSFWARSSVTGSYAGRFSAIADGRVYVFTYLISQADTWERKTINIAGDTSGTWSTVNSRGIQIIWDLGSGSDFNGTAGVWGTSNVTRTSGSVNWIATSGATFYITGVQLEAGDIATPFEHRSYGQELALCQRYYQQVRSSTAHVNGVNSGVWRSTSYLPVAMRAQPSLSLVGTPNYLLAASENKTISSIVSNYSIASVVQFDADFGSSATNPLNGFIATMTADAAGYTTYVAASAEL